MSYLERILRALLDAEGIPKPELEFNFFPPRRWRFDLYWPDHKLACEVEGGIWIQGRHNRGKGFLADIEKYNTATLLGFRVIRVTKESIENGDAIKWIKKGLNEAVPYSPVNKIGTMLRTLDEFRYGRLGMYTFSKSSLDKLSTCHEDLQVLAKECIKYRDVIILEGHRNQADQDKAFAEGKSKLKYPNGKHNALPSLAMDMGYFPDTYSSSANAMYFSGWVMGLAQMLYNIGKMKHKIRNGADWNQNGLVSDENFQDTFHFEIINP